MLTSNRPNSRVTADSLSATVPRARGRWPILLAGIALILGLLLVLGLAVRSNYERLKEANR